MHKFDASRAGLLDSEERRKFLPPEDILRKIGVREDTIFADIGCGTGYFTIPAAEMAERGNVFAIDMQEEMLEMLKEKISGKENITIVSSTEDKIPLPDESVDIAFMANVLHEIDGDGTLREAHRILRHGGILVVVDWKKEKTEIGPPMEHRLSLKEAEFKIKGVGLSPKDSFEIQPYHYCIVANK